MRAKAVVGISRLHQVTKAWNGPECKTRSESSANWRGGFRFPGPIGCHLSSAIGRACGPILPAELKRNSPWPAHNIGVAPAMIDLTPTVTVAVDFPFLFGANGCGVPADPPPFLSLHTATWYHRTGHVQAVWQGQWSTSAHSVSRLPAHMFLILAGQSHRILSNHNTSVSRQVEPKTVFRRYYKDSWLVPASHRLACKPFFMQHYGLFRSLFSVSKKARFLRRENEDNQIT